MAWTAPATWAAAVVTTTQMNTEIRDHLNFLKGWANLITNTTVADTGTTCYLSITRPTSGDDAFRAVVTGDAYARYVVHASGKLNFGPGSAAADTYLERVGTGILQFTETRARATGAAAGSAAFEALVTGDSYARVTLGADGKHSWGSGGGASDSYLERLTTGIMRFTETRVRASAAAAATTTFDTLVTGDAVTRWAMGADGKQSWGAGSGALDTVMERAGAGIVRFTETRARVSGSSASSTAFEALVTGDGVQRWTVDADGKQSWGAGSGAVDTNVYRSAANRLKTDDLVDATVMGLATFTKAGTPSDADWAVAPPVGTLAVDTTNFYLYVRTAAATWKRTATLV